MALTHMGSIRLLDQATVNMIAAGEVIDRPASVVKELVENSLDAGATQIDISVEQGGRREIAVIDNGCGMEPDDLAMAFEPHATSKVRSAEDLGRIRTYGFRGEALASIAAVAQVKAISRTKASNVAYCIEIDCGEKGPVMPCSGSEGTAIYVRDLFYRVPARQRFLRSAQTEMDHIVEQFARIALATYGLGQVQGPDLTLVHNGRPLYILPRGQDLIERIGRLFPALDGAGGLLEVRSSTDQIDIHGVIGLPDICRANNRLQYLFLNGRFIKDRFISHAIRQAYEGLIDEQRQPIAFLYLQMDGGAFDVNVHPTKMEVRFYQPNLVHDQVLKAIRDALVWSDLAVPVKIGDIGGRPITGHQQQDRAERIRSAIAGYVGVHQARPERVQEPTSLYQPSQGTQTGPRFMQIADKYIVVQTADGLEIVDQHALHEMVLYDKICRQLDSDGLSSQRLLIIPTVRLSAHQVQLLETHGQLIKRLGIELEPHGQDCFRILAFPLLLGDVDPAAFLVELLDTIEEHQQAGPAQVADAVAAMGACKAAVKAGQRLSDQEIEELLGQGLGRASIKRCPHGRPTGIRLTLQDLDRQFHRT